MIWGRSSLICTSKSPKSQKSLLKLIDATSDKFVHKYIEWINFKQAFDYITAIKLYNELYNPVTAYFK